jgi:TMEM175 potassium channel family protein
MSASGEVRPTLLPEERREATYRGAAGVDRLTGFGSGVFALAMTLLVGQLAVPIVSPDKASSELPGQLLNLAPRILTLMIAFTVGATYWAAYRRIFSYVIRYDNVLFALNFSLLFLVALQPFATNLLGRYGSTSIAVMTYAGLLTLTGLIILALWWYVSFGAKLTTPDLDPAVIRHHMWRAVVAPFFFALSIPIALISPIAAEASWIAIGVATLVLSRIYRPRYYKGDPIRREADQT